MKKAFIFLFSTFLLVGFSACKKRGCTLDYAKNFDATAKRDNGKCEYYRKAEILGLKILNFPDSNSNGYAWDNVGYPDLYIRITNDSDAIKYASKTISEIKPNDTVSWSFPSYVTADSSEPFNEFKIYETDKISSAEIIEKFPINFLDFMHESESGLEKYPDSVLYNGNYIEMKIYLNWID
ncbi:MAG: hypothetical protein AB8B74_01190 [Crocinitomicaceae bacterium]